METKHECMIQDGGGPTHSHARSTPTRQYAHSHPTTLGPAHAHALTQAHPAPALRTRCRDGRRPHRIAAQHGELGLGRRPVVVMDETGRAGAQTRAGKDDVRVDARVLHGGRGRLNLSRSNTENYRRAGI